MQEQAQWGLEQVGEGLGFMFLGGIVRMWSVVLASFFRLLFIW